METNDRRTEEEFLTHNWLVTATDKFMSGWGNARGGKSKVAWACKPEHVDAVLAWVESRDEMKFVNVHKAESWKPRNFAHLSIYVVNEGHSSLGQALAPQIP